MGQRFLNKLLPLKEEIMQIFVTFGQSHVHFINDIIFDKDCVAVIECNDYVTGMETVFREFGQKFSMSYSTIPDMSFFPRGLIELK